MNMWRWTETSCTVKGQTFHKKTTHFSHKKEWNSPRT